MLHAEIVFLCPLPPTHHPVPPLRVSLTPLLVVAAVAAVAAAAAAVVVVAGGFSLSLSLFLSP